MNFLKLIFSADTSALDAASKKLDDVTKKSGEAAGSTDKLGTSLGGLKTEASTALNTIAQGFGGLATGASDAASATQQASNGLVNFAAGAIGIEKVKQQYAETTREARALAEQTRKAADEAKAAYTRRIEELRNQRAAMGDARTRASPGSEEAKQNAAIRERNRMLELDARSAARSSAAMAEQAASALVLRGALMTGIGTAIGFAAAIEGISVAARAAADDNAELADKLGISTQQLAAVTLVASENGGSVEGLQRIYDKLSKSLTKLDEDSEKTRYAFESLGLSQKELAGLSESEIAGKVIANYELLGRSTKATSAVTQLLGASFRDQIPSIKAASGEIDDYVERVIKFGADASPALVKAGGDQEKALSDLGLSWKGLSNEIAESGTSIVKSAAEAVAGLLNTIRKGLAEMRGLRESAAQIEAIPQAERNALLKQARDEVYNGTNPNATEGDVNARFKQLMKERIDGMAREAAETEKFKRQAVASSAEIVKAKSDAAKPPSTPTQGRDPYAAALESMQRQRDVTRDTTEYEKTLFETQKGRFKDFTSKQKDVLLNISKEIDLRNQLNESADKQLKAIEAYDQAEERANEQLRQRIEYEKQLAEYASKRLLQFGRDVLGEEAANRQDTGLGQVDRRAGADMRSVAKEAQAAIDQLTPYMAGYEEQVKKIRDAEYAATEAIREGAEQRKAYNIDWTNGARNALGGYLDLVNDVAGQTEQALGKAFRGAEDAIVSFVTTGKASLSELASSIITDLFRIYIRQAALSIFQAGSNFLGAFGGGGGGSFLDAGTTFGPNFAAGGGNIAPGSTTIVGEYGPEVLQMGNQAGYVTPNWMMQKAGGGGTTINITVNGGKTNEETGTVVSQAVLNAMKQIADGRITNALQPGGIIRNGAR